MDAEEREDDSSDRDSTLVDDEEDARVLLAEVLSGHGANVTAVASVAEALRAVQEDPPDVLVSDIGMPRPMALKTSTTARSEV